MGGWVGGLGSYRHEVLGLPGFLARLKEELVKHAFHQGFEGGDDFDLVWVHVH